MVLSATVEAGIRKSILNHFALAVSVAGKSIFKANTTYKRSVRPKMMFNIPFAMTIRLVVLSVLVNTGAKFAESAQSHKIVHLNVGELFVPDSYDSAQTQIDLLVHFHGATDSVVKSFELARLNGVLIVINYPGLSSVYRRPFESSNLFDQILNEAMESLRQQSVATENAHWGHMCVSSFSAGYAAIREILKQKDNFERVDGILCADSIYASLESGVSSRRVEPIQMKHFVRYAQLAAAGKKSFVLTHSYLHTPTYASTVETANVLIDSIGARRHRLEENGPGAMRLVSRVEQGNFLLLGYEGNDGPAHMQHLKNLAAWLPFLPIEKREK